MVGLEGINGASPVTRHARAGGRAAPGGFRVESTAAEAAGVFAAGTVAGPGLLGLERVEGEAESEGKARSHARGMLAELARLQRELLAGRISRSRLGELGHLAEAVPDTTDPGLRTVLAALTLRAKVELARYDVLRDAAFRPLPTLNDQATEMPPQSVLGAANAHGYKPPD